MPKHAKSIVFSVFLSSIMTSSISHANSSQHTENIQQIVQYCTDGLASMKKTIDDGVPPGTYTPQTNIAIDNLALVYNRMQLLCESKSHWKTTLDNLLAGAEDNDPKLAKTVVSVMDDTYQEWEYELSTLNALIDKAEEATRKRRLEAIKKRERDRIRKLRKAASY